MDENFFSLPSLSTIENFFDRESFKAVSEVKHWFQSFFLHAGVVPQSVHFLYKVFLQLGEPHLQTSIVRV